MAQILNNPVIIIGGESGGGSAPADSLWQDFIASKTRNYSYLFFASQLEDVDRFVKDMQPPLNMESMFVNCWFLKKIKMDTSQATIVGSAFQNCTQLQTVDVTNFDSVLGDTSFSLFGYCPNLKTIIFRTTTGPFYNNNSFERALHYTGEYDATYNPNSLKDGRIYVPKGVVATYRQDGSWFGVSDLIRPISSFEAWGPGWINEHKSGNDTIFEAVSDGNANFLGWYKGFISIGYEPSNPVGPSRAESNPDTEYSFTPAEDGYYVSTNQGVGDSSCVSRFYFTKTSDDQQVYIHAIQSSENTYDYGLVGQPNVDLPPWPYEEGTYAMNLKNTIDTDGLIPLTNIGVGEEFFIDVKYMKDGSNDIGTDTLTILLQIVNTQEVPMLIEDEFYSADATINVGVVDEMTMDPLYLVAMFE